MLRTVVRGPGAFLFGLLSILPMCDESSTFTPPDTKVAAIELSGCGALGVGSTCTLTARAWNAQGEELQEPFILFSSKNRVIATVASTGPNSAEVSGRTEGVATIEATDATRRTKTSTTISVAKLKPS